MNIFFVKNDDFFAYHIMGRRLFGVVNEGAKTLFAYQMMGRGLFWKKTNLRMLKLGPASNLVSLSSRLESTRFTPTYM